MKKVYLIYRDDSELPKITTDSVVMQWLVDEGYEVLLEADSIDKVKDYIHYYYKMDSEEVDLYINKLLGGTTK